jgi:hypothetical protein
MNARHLLSHVTKHVTLKFGLVGVHVSKGFVLAIFYVQLKQGANTHLLKGRGRDSLYILLLNLVCMYIFTNRN